MEDKHFFDDMMASQQSNDHEDGSEDQDWAELEDLSAGVATDTEFLTDDAEEGLLPFDSQQAVQKLIKVGKIEREKHEKLYEVLRRDAKSVRTLLKNLAITMHIDEQEGIVFTGQLEDEEGEPLGTLIHVQTLRLYETWVMLILREYYQEREAAGERVIAIELEEIESRLVPFMPLSKSESADRNRIVGFLNRLVSKYRVLSEDKSGPDQYRISSVIRHIVSAEELTILLEDYQKLAEEAMADQDGHITPRLDTLTEQEADEQQEDLDLTLEQGARDE